MADATAVDRETDWARPARRFTGDAVFATVVRVCGAVVVAVLVAMTIFLVVAGWPALREYGVGGFLGSTRWAPSEARAGIGGNPYGIVQFVYGTMVTALIGMLIAVPVSVAVALVITHVAPRRVRRPLANLVDLLAAVPSVVYGFWGVFALKPALDPVAEGLIDSLGRVPVVGALFAGPFFGYSYLTAGLVLAIMVVPIVTAICREVFATTPRADTEAALALGATRWESLRMAVLPRARSGIVGAAILGLGRAVGETIAVTMVIGNALLAIDPSLLGQGATLASVIASQFNEARAPFQKDSLFVVALCLLVISLVINVAGRAIVGRISRGART